MKEESPTASEPAFEDFSLDVDALDVNEEESVPGPPTEEHTAPSKPDAPRGARNGAKSGEFDPIDLRDRVVIKLLFEASVTIEQVEEAWHRWKRELREGSSRALWRILAELDSVTEDVVLAEAASVYAFKEVEQPTEAISSFLEECREHFEQEALDRLIDMEVIPAARKKVNGNGRTWIFATPDPLRPAVQSELRSLGLGRFELRYIDRSALRELIRKAFPKRNEYLERIQKEDLAIDIGSPYEDRDALFDQDKLEAEIGSSALIDLFEAMLIEAVRAEVSDIHIFPGEKRQLKIHFRQNGELVPWHTETRIHPEAFLAVVKDNSTNVDRFERDRLQDGYIQRWIDNVLIRFRVSILPLATADQGIRSESVVIRVLDDRKVISSLDKLGLQEQALRQVERAIRQPSGMVILTGPTGSGKTTTLYAALQQVVSPKVNVLTVEDPVEYVLPGVRQVKLSHKLTVSEALRGILRHDPDIVMVGEMRDTETAELAIKLANTGHLTFSTLHTNDAPSAVSRLYKMGIEPFLIAYAINLVVAQRLIRTLCPSCKQPAQPSEMLLEELHFTEKEIENANFFRAGGDSDCVACGGTGYDGRRAISEVMASTEEIQEIIVKAGEMVDEHAIRKSSLRNGMRTLQESARSVVVEGNTSIEEMMRVVAT